MVAELDAGFLLALATWGGLVKVPWVEGVLSRELHLSNEVFGGRYGIAALRIANMIKLVHLKIARMGLWAPPPLACLAFLDRCPVDLAISNPRKPLACHAVDHRGVRDHIRLPVDPRYSSGDADSPKCDVGAPSHLRQPREQQREGIESVQHYMWISTAHKRMRGEGDTGEYQGNDVAHKSCCFEAA